MSARDAPGLHEALAALLVAVEADDDDALASFSAWCWVHIDEIGGRSIPAENQVRVKASFEDNALTMVRRQLRALVIIRSARALSSQESIRYNELCVMESMLMTPNFEHD
jgi:hypothetical protein